MMTLVLAHLFQDGPTFIIRPGQLVEMGVQMADDLVFCFREKAEAPAVTD